MTIENTREKRIAELRELLKVQCHVFYDLNKAIGENIIELVSLQTEG